VSVFPFGSSSQRVRPCEESTPTRKACWAILNVRAVCSRVESHHAVDRALADPQLSGERDEDRRLDRAGAVTPAHAPGDRVDLHQRPVRLKYPDGAVSGRDGAAGVGN
jgi:hypothetical protein